MNKMFQGKVAVVTGGAQGIGKTVAEEFKKNGAAVCVIDKKPNDFFSGDIADEETLVAFSQKVVASYGRVDFLVNNALPISKGIDSCSWNDFNYALSVGVSAPFYLTKLFLPYFAEGASIVNISSSRDRMSQPNTESYTAAKGGIAALTHALAVSLAGKVRVNSVSPGWIDTSFKQYSGADSEQHPVRRVGNPLDIAHTVLFLCSGKAGFITGENICVDGGMTKQMIYSGDYNWTLNPAE
ncbi:MAG: SDR family oxidoreductase [Bacteroidales bacterium]|jgi:NAD(P)-dependent dehydrogenase (short-subunit alcohol dehydrogenase family)|nr:SDR family oxidoreductase [Bacteroidales bacterium]